MSLVVMFRLAHPCAGMTSNCTFRASFGRTMTVIASSSSSSGSARAATRAWLVGGVLLGSGAALVGVGLQPTLVVGPVLGGLGALVAEADLRSRRVPDRLILIGVLAAIVIAVLAEVTMGDRPSLSMAIGALTTSLPLLIVHVVAPAQAGFGDVKLSALIGALLAPIVHEFGVG